MHFQLADALLFVAEVVVIVVVDVDLFEVEDSADGRQEASLEAATEIGLDYF